LQTGGNVCKLVARAEHKVSVVPIERDHSLAWNESVATSESTNCHDIDSDNIRVWL
jgi:hypothetical protein